MTRRRWVLAVLAAAAVVLVAGRALASLFVEQVWFEALGLPRLATANLTGALLLRGGTTILASLFLFAHLYAVRRSVVSFVLPRQVGDLEFGEEVPGQYLVGSAAVLALAIGSFLGVDGAHWPQFALALDGVHFGERDPYFENDLGFYVGWLPAELLLFQWAQRLLLVTALVVALLYALTPSMRWRGRRLYVSEYVRRHLTILGGILLVLFAWGFRLESYQMLLHGSGVGGAFAAVDLQVRVPGSLVLAATSLAAGLLVIGAGFGGQVRLAFFAVSVMLLLSGIVRLVLPVALRPSGDPNRAEAPYLATRDGFTRRAFGADLVRIDTSGATGAVVPGTRSVAIWDAAALRRAVDGAAGVGWSRVGDQVHAIVAQRGFVDGAETSPWAVARLAGWMVDAGGGPVALRAESGEVAEVLPPVVSIDTAPVYRIVPDAGALIAGAPASEWGMRLAHAWALQNFRILLGTLPGPEPTVVLRPLLRDRIAAVAPFFAQGDMPRPAIAADTLFWVVELYSAADTYPLAEPFILAGEEWRYFHPAGHAVVNAATGVIRVVPVADAEPITQVWIRRFPELFIDAAELPAGLAGALLPHAEVLRARALTFARIGPTARRAPRERRQLVVEQGADSALAGGLVPLALAGTPGLALVTPVLDPRDRIAGLVVASGPDTRTEWVPAGAGAPAWGSVLDALRTVDSTAARRDARRVRGRVRVLPTTDGIVFAQPTYLWPTRGQPALVSVSSVGPAGSTTARVLQLGTAADSAAEAGAPEPVPPRALYQRMREALRQGDWATFGSLFDSLGRALGATP